MPKLLSATAKILLFVKSCLVLNLTLVLWSTTSEGQLPNITDQARREGEVVLYTTLTVNDFEPFRRAAKKTYPFLNIQHVYLNASTQVSKVMLEHKLGNLGADVIGNNLATMLYYKAQGVIGQYSSPNATQLIKGSVDPDKYWAGITAEILVTGINTKMTSKKNAPQSYDEYLSPKFKGQMAIHGAGPFPLLGMVSLKGEDQGISYIQKLSQQDLRLVDSYTNITNLLAAGEYPLGIFTHASKIEVLREKGAPVDWVPGSPTFATISAIGITQNPLHPAAARFLVDFYLSAEGQQALVSAGKLPLRLGVAGPSKNITDLLDKGNIHVIRPEGDQNKYLKLYNELIRRK